MKRVSLLFAVLLFASFTLTSCLKSRVCKCTSALHPENNYNYTVGPSKKSAAEAECENYQTSGRTSYTPDYTCTLD